MGDDLPLLTMVKSKEINESPSDLSNDCFKLLNTLSSLCSFYSIEDFVSFIFSEKFTKLIDYDEPWLVFEIGLYLDHQKNIQFIASKNSYLFVDNVRIGWNGGSFNSKNKNEIFNELSKWCEIVFNPNARFE
tara:strand:+ start:304 stop:699 length:396 start_codon:yes stop_codon:yes gene_type:complete